MLLLSSCEKITSLLPPGGDLGLLFLYVYRHDAVDILFDQLTLALTILEEHQVILLFWGTLFAGFSTLTR